VVNIDWQLVVDIIVPIACVFLGAWATRRFESRPALISYYQHVSAFKYSLDTGQQVDVFTHAVVLRNAGRRAATSVRIRHRVFPAHFNVWPSVAYAIEELPGGVRELVIPRMVPGEQITISYLYHPPLTVADIHDGIKSDEGFATAIPVLLQRQFPRWMTRTLTLLSAIGAAAVLYVLILIIRFRLV
jgi:hypothetical protein